MSFSFKRSITIDHTKVGTVNNTDQANFPFLFGGQAGPYSYLKLSSFGGQIQNIDTVNGQTVADDLIFTSDAAGLNLLKWEIASYDYTTGNIEVWIQIPNLSHLNDTIIYMLYGDTNTSTYQGGAIGAAWDANYVGVWHFPNGTTLALKDSTANGNNLTNSGLVAASGQINGGFSNSGANTATSPTFSSVTTKTVSIWFKTTSNGNYQIIFGGGPASDELWAAEQTTNFSHFIDNGNNLGTSSSSADSNWHYLVGVADSSVSGMKLYFDGIFITATTITTGSLTSFTLGDRQGSSSFPFQGSGDELRISNIVRTADWIKTEYNNQFSTSTFYTVSAPLGVTSVGRRTFGFPGTRVGSRQMQ